MDGLLESVFDTMTEGFSIQQILTDSAGEMFDLKYIAINPAFERATGLRAADILGKTKRELFPCAIDWTRPYVDVARTGEPATFQAEFGPLGRSFQISAFKIDPNHLAVLFFDITDRKRAEEAVEAASNAKDHFLAVLSHELRTPLTPALAAIQMLESDKSLPPELHEMLRMIRRNVQLEARLIDDLLDVTRITRNKLELQLSTIDMHEKIGHVLKICSADATAKSLVVTTDFQATRTQVEADAARLQQIVWNVIKNAIKFSHPNGTIDIRTENTTTGQITVAVSDEGIGIDAEAMKHIFDAFNQGGREVTRKFGGLGLGLTISKVLVEMHKGTITAASDGPGKGARFSITLPNKSVPTPSANNQSDEKSKAGANGSASLRCTVLLVEDHTDTRRIMTRLLTRMGCEVKPASTGAEALAIAEQERLDLVISDIGLPDISGLDLMRQLKVRLGLRGIALSGYGMEEDLQRSKDAGFERHLTKPINLQTLEETVRKMTAI